MIDPNAAIKTMNYAFLKNKRIAAIDFGLVRVGIAVTDELHISITPKITLLYQKIDFWEKLVNLLKAERIGGIVVGIPFEQNGEYSLKEEIDIFIDRLNRKADIPIFFQDESYTSVKAVDTMLEIGKKKKKRTEKGMKDRIAAAIILKDFLDNL